MPAALGLKLGNRELTVIAAGGDGDGYAIGMGHFIHAIRRNPDITYLVMDNQIYGLTKGQSSPTSAEGFLTRSTPEGTIEHPVRPMQLAIAAGATFVAQGFSSNQKQLVDLIKAGIGHKGFSLINTVSPCVTFNKVNTYDWYKQSLLNLDTVPDYNPSDRAGAMAMLMERDEMVNGLVYEAKDTKPFEDKLIGFRAEGIANQDWHVDEALFNKILDDYR
jgi:2-oxoglutarate ferredoxin oxidoreductase subunit beta